MSRLAGKRVLVVEDEFFIALMVSDMLEHRGAIVVGPAASVAAALPIATSGTIDAAVLDANLGGVPSEPVAIALQRAGVPFVIATGYGAGVFPALAGVPVLDKPYSPERLAAMLCELFG